MARKASKAAKKPAAKGRGKSKSKRRIRPFRWLFRRLFWAGLVCAVLVFAVIAALTVVNPPTTHTMWSEGRRLGGIDHEWVDVDEVAPVMLRSVVAAEDANFCLHWGFDVAAIRLAMEEGANRGASTLTQQTVKNVFLWQKRSWFRKAAEALLTPAVEVFWSKRRILELYLNIAEFDEGVFGIDAASYHYFGVGPGELSATQAARLAAVLPSPKKRSASKPTEFLRKRAASIRSGAATIAVDGRAACFED